MRRAVIFDLGGVLLKTVDYAPRHAWDARLGLPPGSVERAAHNRAGWVAAQAGRLSIAEYWRDVAEQMGLPPEDTQQLAVDFYSGDRLDLELIDYIRMLRQNGHQVALLSNETVELRGKLGQLGILNLFDPVVISAEIGVMKPAAAAYQSVLESLGRPPQETAFVDDRLENVQGARALGIHAIRYIAGMDLPAALASLLVEEP